MIIPSIASANPMCYGEEIRRLGSHPRLHIDIEDGNFIPNITFGLKTVRSIRANFPHLVLDAHLMVSDPSPYIGVLAELGVREIAFHLESMDYPLAMLNSARDAGMLPGLALNFSTPVAAIVPFTDAMDFVLIMTAEPDGRGDRFHASAPGRIREARSILPSEKAVWVDGGIGEEELPVVRAAGASTVIMGRAIFSAADPAEKLAAFLTV